MSTDEPSHPAEPPFPGLPHDLERRRTGPVWLPLATAAVTAAVLGTTVTGSQATALSSTPNGPAAGAPDSTTSLTTSTSTLATAAAGTLLLDLRDNGDGLDEDLTGLAPGDSTNRYLDLVETGTLDGRNLTLTARATGALSAELTVTVHACRNGTWRPAAGTCTGRVDRLLPPTRLTDLDRPRVLDPLGPARRLPLRLTLTLADRQETTTNGVLPATSLQGAATRLTWTFSTTQT